VSRWSKSLLVVMLALVPAAAHAQVFGQWRPATVLPINAHEFGAQLELSEHVIGGLADLRLSLYPDVDFGFQGGLSRVQIEGSDIATARLAADFKWQTLKVSAGGPFDLAFGAFIGLESGDRLGRLVVGPLAVASRGVTMDGKERMVPYLGVQARYTQFQYQSDPRNDFSVPLRLGVVFPIVQGFRVGAEAELRLGNDIDDHQAFGVSVDFDI
jgi:hypothetical protein